MHINQRLIHSNKYPLKCPYEMNPKYITIHNTSNKATALQEVEYMLKNGKPLSFHVAVDDKEAIQAIPFTRNAWHAGDGSKGVGNRNSIGIEICYSVDYNSTKHEMSFYNAVQVVKRLMVQFDIPIKNIKQHYDWSGKDCPHRIRQEGTWDKFLSLCETKEKEDLGMKLKSGYQSVMWSGQPIHLYKGNEALELGMMSAKGKVDYQARQTIDKIDDDRVHYCKVNANYFNMGDGQHYGVEYTPQFKAAPKQKEWLALWVDLDGVIHYRNAADFWLDSSQVKFACSPAAVLIHGGEEVNLYSSAAGESKKTTANTQTMLLQLSSGEFVLGVVSGRLSPNQCIEFANACGASHLSIYDGGGSSQMVADGTKKVYTARAVANVFTLYKSEKTTAVESDDETEAIESSDRTLVVSKVGLYVRSELKFSNSKACGSILKFCPIGGEVEILDFMDEIQVDGYQWAKVRYQGVEGYSQYDSTCYWIKD